jgi:hypothetical protein
VTATETFGRQRNADFLDYALICEASGVRVTDAS